MPASMKAGRTPAPRAGRWRNSAPTARRPAPGGWRSGWPRRGPAWTDGEDEVVDGQAEVQQSHTAGACRLRDEIGIGQDVAGRTQQAEDVLADVFEILFGKAHVLLVNVTFLSFKFQIYCHIASVYHNPTEAVKLSICTTPGCVYCSLFLKTGRRRVHHAGQDFILSGRSVAGIEQHRAAGVGKDVFSRMGGSAASLALAYAAQGGRASLLTQLGEDAFGHRIADALSTAGVDISRICLHLPRPHAAAVRRRRRTARLPHPFFGAALCTEQLGADWAADAEMLAFSSACLVDSPCRYTHLAALDTARTAGVPVCFFPSLRPTLWPGEKTLRDTVLQFLPFADILLLTADEMELLLGHPGIPGRAVRPAAGAYPAGGA